MFPQTSAHPVIGQPFIVLPRVDSTNNYAMGQVHEGLAKHGATWLAIDQTNGKGQRSKRWITAPGMNILMSIVFEPKLLGITKTFDLSALVIFSCYQFFKKYAGQEITIKWPNDLYWRDRKAGGILIENILRGSDWLYSVAGIGLNINQETFDPRITNPVSLYQITGFEKNIIELAEELCGFIQRTTEFLKNPEFSLLNEFNQALYCRHKKVRLKKGNITFETTIIGVNDSGQLLTSDATDRCFEFGEVEWLLEEKQ